MSRTYALAFLAAAAIHLLLLFGFQLGKSARMLPITDSAPAIEASLVESGPEEAEEAPPLGEIAAAKPTEPEPTPEPEPPEEMEEIPPPQPPPPTETIPEMAKPAESTPPPEIAKRPAPTVPPRPQATPSPVRPKAHAHVPTAAPSDQASREGTPTGVPGGSGRNASASAKGRGRGKTAQARYLSNPKPDYPPEAKRLKQQGVVVIHASIDAQGRLTDFTLAKSSGYPLLDQAALQKFRSYRFAPATEMGLPVASTLNAPIRFSLSH